MCRTHGCTTFSLLGGMSTAIYSEPLRPDDADNPVRFVVSAGMPLAVWEAFEKRFGLKVFEWYGAVEGGAAFKPVGQGPIGSFGKPAPGLDMRILDDNDVECPPGVVGEICSRPMPAGARRTVEYHGNREASEKKTRGGWLRSGDMGHTDEEGWFYFDYRKGGGIRHNGDFVNADFVEKVIAEHAAVSDVFVYGIPAASGAPGEKDVVAAIVPVDRGELLRALRLRKLSRGPRVELRPVLSPGAGRDPEDGVGEAPGTLPAGGVRPGAAQRLRRGARLARITEGPSPSFRYLGYQPPTRPRCVEKPRKTSRAPNTKTGSSAGAAATAAAQERAGGTTAACMA